MTFRDITIGDVLNCALPPLSIAVWCAIYVVYFWRRQEVRDWFARSLHHRRSRPRPPAGRPPAGRPPPRPAILFRPAPPPPVPRPRTALITATGQAAVRLAEWRAGNLPLRYRLLGQVRRPENDN